MKDNKTDNPKDANQAALEKNPMEESDIPSKSQESLYKDELEDADEKAEIEYGKTAVARNSKQNMIMIGIMLLVVGIILYFAFFKTTSKTVPVENDSSEANKPISAADELSLPNIPNSPVPPADFSLPGSQKQIQKPKPPEFAPPAAPAVVEPKKPLVTHAPPIEAPSNVPQQQALQAKIQSPMMLGGDDKSSGKSSDEAKKKAAQMYVENFIPEHTSSAQQKVTKVGNMSLLVAQGKVIETVLETPVNTNYPGPIRAVVSSDVYSENGNNVLIPRGSRVVGQFTGSYSPGQTRVNIVWDRIIMPNGYDIAVSSPAVGPIGTAGVEGVVDTQILPTITNAVLISALNVAFAQAASNLTGSGQASQTSTSTAPGGVISSTTTTTPTQQAIQQQTTNLGNTLQGLAQQTFSTKPFITLDQGTLVSIFVNRDLLFPSSLSNNGVVIK
jgi:type IV secretion system protein VirB10